MTTSQRAPASVSVWNIANYLTVLRIALVPVFGWLLLADNGRSIPYRWAALGVFVVAMITDRVDGDLARSRGLVTDFGKVADPIADKLLVGSALMLLAGLGHLSRWGLLPAIVIMLREILVSGLREFLAGLAAGLPVTRLAKWKTAAQMIALGMLLAGDGAARLLELPWLPVGIAGEVLLWAAALLTLLTGWDYLRAALRHAMAEEKQRPARPGPLAGKTAG